MIRKVILALVGILCLGAIVSYWLGNAFTFTRAAEPPPAAIVSVASSAPLRPDGHVDYCYIYPLLSGPSSNYDPEKMLGPDEVSWVLRGHQAGYPYTHHNHYRTLLSDSNREAMVAKAGELRCALHEPPSDCECP
jgi:hypothetical protein